MKPPLSLAVVVPTFGRELLLHETLRGVDAEAVTFGGGGLYVANAASSTPSSVVTIDPVCILDTRTDVGMAGRGRSCRARRKSCR